MSKNILNIYYRETLDVVDSYEEYLSSMHITLDTQLWKKSLLFNTKKAYQKYVDKYPKGNYRDEAQLKINEFNAISKREEEAKAWNTALNKNTKSSYETYLMSYYNGLYSNEAKIKVDEFIQLEKEKKLEEQRLKDIEIAKEKEAWEQACLKDKHWSYSKYLEVYPNGIYKSEAKSLYEMMHIEVTTEKHLDNRLFVFKVNGKKGIINRNKEVIIEAKYSEILPLGDRFILINKNSKSGLVNIYGETIIELGDYNLRVDRGAYKTDIKIANEDSGNIVSIIKDDKETIYKPTSMSLFSNKVIKIKDIDNYTFGYISENEQLLLKPIYTEIILHTNKLGIIRTKDDKYGLIDNNYNIILEVEYDHISLFSDKIIEANHIGAGSYLYNVNGKKIISYTIDYLENTKSNNICKYSKDSKYGLINTDGKEITSLHDEIIEQDKRIFMVKNNGKYGIIDNKGKYIFKLEYDEIQVYKGFIKLHKHFSVGLTDYDGNFILNREWIDISISDEFILFTKNKQTGAMNHKGKTLLEHGTYWQSSIEIRRKSKYGKELLEYGTLMKTGVIDSDGNDVIPLMNNFKYNIVQTKFFKELW